MAIKAGAIIHDANGTVINRIQSAGPGTVNIAEEKVYEVGNDDSVCTVRDIPDLTFDMESLAVSTEIEALLLNRDPTATVTQDEFNLDDAVPIDIISPFKSGTGAYDVTHGVVVPHLTLASASYSFGLRQNATQSFSLNGDTIVYVHGSPYKETQTPTAGTGQVYTFANTGITLTDGASTLFAYNITAKDSTTGAYKRLFEPTDYTNTSAGYTIAEDLSLTYDEIHVVYGSLVAATYNASVHAGGTQPCAIRGKDIDVYVSDGAATPTLVRWDGVQSFQVDWSRALENDEEFGNTHFVDTSFETSEVTGSIGVKALDAANLWAKIANITGTDGAESMGAATQVPLQLEVRLSDPDNPATVIKTFYVSDANFSAPSISSTVNSKLETTFNFTSDSGSLLIYEDTRP
jgi:hypothetical protein